jgi:hypothetical protein
MDVPLLERQQECSSNSQFLPADRALRHTFVSPLSAHEVPAEVIALLAGSWPADCY